MAKIWRELAQRHQDKAAKMKSGVGQNEVRSLHHVRTDEEQVEVDAPILAPWPDRRPAHDLLEPLQLSQQHLRGQRRLCRGHPIDKPAARGRGDRCGLIEG